MNKKIAAAVSVALLKSVPMGVVAFFGFVYITTLLMERGFLFSGLLCGLLGIFFPVLPMVDGAQEVERVAAEMPAEGGRARRAFSSLYLSAVLLIILAIASLFVPAETPGGARLRAPQENGRPAQPPASKIVIVKYPAPCGVFLHQVSPRAMPNTRSAFRFTCARNVSGSSPRISASFRYTSTT